MDKPFIGPEFAKRMVGRTNNLEEANRIAERYEAEGYAIEIVKKTQAGLTVYEIWAGKKPDVFSGAPGTPSF